MRWHLMAFRPRRVPKKFPLATAANCWQLHRRFPPRDPAGRQFISIIIIKTFPLFFSACDGILYLFRVEAGICYQISICLSMYFQSGILHSSLKTRVSDRNT